MPHEFPKLESVRGAAERAAIVRALEETDTRTEAAEALGIGRSSLYRKMEQYGLYETGFGFGGPPLPDGVDGLLADALERENDK